MCYMHFFFFYIDFLLKINMHTHGEARLYRDLTAKEATLSFLSNVGHLGRRRCCGTSQSVCFFYVPFQGFCLTHSAVNEYKYSV